MGSGIQSKTCFGRQYWSSGKKKTAMFAALEELKFLYDVETLVLKFILVTVSKGRLEDGCYTINSLYA